MKIIFVLDGLQFGGIERVAIEYIKLLIKKGYSVHVLNLRPSLSAMENELPHDVKVMHLFFPRCITTQRYSKLKRMGLIGKILFLVCEIILMPLQKIYKVFYRRKILTGDIAIAFSGHYNDLTFVCENYKNKIKIAWLHGSQASYNNIAPGYFTLYKKIKNLVCLSEKEDEYVAEFNTIHHINKKLIYNPINLKERKINYNIVDKLKYKYEDFIIMIGRMAKDKDQATLILAIKYLNKKYGLYKKLVLVGDGPEKENLEKIVRSENLSNQVFFEGARADVQNYYTAATVYAHSSPAEGLPTVLLEAMYYELPIAATNSEPGVQEILQNNCGLVTPVGNAEALADSIYKLYTDKKLVLELHGKCKERIKSFLPDYVMSQVEEYIDYVCDKQNNNLDI